MSERKYLETIRYSKSIQKRINININHYKAYCEEYSSIELDIIPKKGEFGSFINIKEEDKKKEGRITKKAERRRKTKKRRIRKNKKRKI